MKTPISKRIGPAVLILGLTGSAIGITADGALAATTKSVSGTIKTVNAKADKLTVTASKKSETFLVSSKTKVTLSGKTSTLGSLRAGDTVTVDYTISGKLWTASSISAESI